MKLRSFWRPWRKSAGSDRPAGYSRYTDPAIFPAFGGDERDPPPYATDRRSTVDAPRMTRRGVCVPSPTRP